MEEKIIIKSKIDEKTKSTIQATAIISLALSLLIFWILLSVRIDSYHYYYISGLEAVFEGYPGCIVFFCIMCFAFVVGITYLIILFAFKKCSITITDSNVKGKSFFGKEVVLPLYMVSAYSTRKLFSTITVATSAGLTKFALIGNYNEIGNELSKLINERQDKTRTNNSTTTQNSSVDEIVKLKSLLDNEIITQEEFDAKKKQILGL